MGTMVSIYDIMNGEPNWMELKFNKYKESFLVDEYYCINASCECQQVCLTFLKLTEDGAANNKVFSFYLNLNTFKITDIDVLDPSYDFSYMISSFKESLGDFVGNYARNYKKAKEYGMKHNNLHTSKENIQESLKNGLTISYSDIFENSTPIEIILDNVRYLIDDHYCLDPKCWCDEVLLTFFRHNPLMNDYQVLFTAHYPFKSKNYYLENEEKNKNHNKIMDYIIKERIDLITLYQTRYKEVKTKGKDYSRDMNKPIISSKVGRNESCPCNSGKKYKHCCGRV